jgi:integrase
LTSELHPLAGGKPGTGLGVRSARLMVGRLSAAFEQGIDGQKVYRNPCRKVRVDGRPQPPRITWSAEQLRRFLAAADADRLAPVWRLMSYGLRRSEGAGLLWSNVRLAERTVTIGPVRVMVNGRAVSKPNPKSENGWRTLPLDDVVAAQLEALQARQMEEMLTAEPAYEGGDHVASDQLGRPVSPEWLSDEFQRADGHRRRTGERPRAVARAHPGGRGGHLHPRPARGPGPRRHGA